MLGAGKKIIGKKHIIYFSPLSKPSVSIVVLCHTEGKKLIASSLTNLSFTM